MDEIKELLGIVAEYLVRDAHRKGILQGQTAGDLARIREIRFGKHEPKIETAKPKPIAEVVKVSAPTKTTATKSTSKGGARK